MKACDGDGGREDDEEAWSKEEEQEVSGQNQTQRTRSRAIPPALPSRVTDGV